MQESGPLIVYCTLSTREALKELVPIFERESNERLQITYSGGSVLTRQLVSDTAGDLFIGPDDFADELVSKGVLRKPGRQPIAVSRTALAIAANAPVPATSTVEDVKQLLSDARSFCYSPGASGIYFTALLKSMGIGDDIARKAVQPAPGEMVGSVVARGGAEVGLQQVSELLPVPGIRLLELPTAMRQEIRYCASVFARAAHPHSASVFVEFLRSRRFDAVWRGKGLEPL